MQKILIIGGVAGGASAAARLRRLNEDAQIIMFERGEYISFANCGLPYYIGNQIKEKSALTVQTPESFNQRFNIDVRINSEVISINREAKIVTVKNSKSGAIYQENYNKLILSPGANPIKPNIKGIDSDKVFTLRNIPDTYKIKEYVEINMPKSVVIVGGGYIGLELAENLKSLDLNVTIVEMDKQVIAAIDYDMACDVHRYIVRKDINLVLDNAVKAIREVENSLIVTLNKGEISADMLIMAIGVWPESSIAKNAGIACNEQGAILVNDNMLTNDQDIYAVGDAVEVVNFITGHRSIIPLAGPANKQGRIASDNICSISSTYPGTQGSAILKIFDMTVATTGINEKTAKRLGIDYEKSFTYSSSHASYYPGAVNISIKTIFHKKTGKILGAQLVGYEGTDKRCDVFATAIHFGATAYDLTKLELCYAPPFSSAKDPVNMAGFVIENIITKKVNVFHWHDIDNLQKCDDVILLDVRTSLEYQNGNIGGFINIPFEELRNRLDQLDKTKKIFVNCQTGLRSYAACRILMQNGFDCYNLSGGYRLYNSIFGSNVSNED